MPSEYLRFERSGALEYGRKTRVWYVLSKSSGDVLGTVSWWAHWRQYTFHPKELCVFNPTCLREIAEFVETQTTLKRALDKAAKALAPAAPVT